MRRQWQLSASPMAVLQNPDPKPSGGYQYGLQNGGNGKAWEIIFVSPTDLHGIYCLLWVGNSNEPMTEFGGSLGSATLHPDIPPTRVNQSQPLCWH